MRLDLVPMVKKDDWEFNFGQKIELLGAHGGEVIRSMLIDTESRAVYTAGEDGCIRRWDQPHDSPSSKQKVTGAKPSKRKRESTGKAARYAPY